MINKNIYYEIQMANTSIILTNVFRNIFTYRIDC